MLNAARAYRRLKEIEEKKLENRLQLLKVCYPLSFISMWIFVI